jgi:hypothetical protein
MNVDPDDLRRHRDVTINCCQPLPTLSTPDPEGDWITDTPPPWPPPTPTVLDAVTDAIMREVDDLSQIDAYRAAQVALLEISRLIIGGGK